MRVMNRAQALVYDVFVDNGSGAYKKYGFKESMGADV